MKVRQMGFDLAKNLFDIYVVDENGNVVLSKTLLRNKVLSIFAQLPPCVVGMETCGSAHYRASELRKLGHEPLPIEPQFVAPHRKNNKNDRSGAEAVCEAVGRPNMRCAAVEEWRGFNKAAIALAAKHACILLAHGPECQAAILQVVFRNKFQEVDRPRKRLRRRRCDGMTGRAGTGKTWDQSRPLEVSREMRTWCEDTHQGGVHIDYSSTGRIQACSQTFQSRILFLQNGGSMQTSD